MKRNILTVLLVLAFVMVNSVVQHSVSAQKNERTFGYLDSPISDANLKGTQTITGWFLNESGVASIDVLVNGNVVGQATYGDARSDVQNTYPEFNNGNAGFHFVLDTTRFNDGQYTIAFKVKGNNGQVTTFSPITVRVINDTTRSYVDNPVSGAVIKGTQNLSGWFLDKNGVDKIEVLVDGNVVGQATYGNTRLDVHNAYPEFNNRNGGLHYKLDTTKFSNGQHSITIRETAVNGRVMILPPFTVTIANEEPRGYIDSLTSGTVINGMKNVSGWFLNRSGTEKIEVLVDGRLVGDATYGIDRLDVQRAYPEFDNAKSGYTYLLDTTIFRNGEHSLQIRETSANGLFTTLPVLKVIIANENPRGYVDYPNEGVVLTGTKNVSGWFLDRSGTDKIEVLVDGKLAGQAILGHDRPDVQKAYPEFKNAKSGYHFSLDTTKYGDGEHKITIRGIGKNGQVTTLGDGNVKFENVKGYVDYPTSNAILTGQKSVSGWYLNTTGVEKIEVSVDGNVVGDATYGDERLDVGRNFPDFNNVNSGYHYLLDTAQFSNGQHRVTIRGIGKNGQVTTLGDGNVMFENVKGYVDNPSSNVVLAGIKNVSGWFLDINGVEKIEVLVDGNVVGDAIYGDTRQDVEKMFPDFNNDKAGFHYFLDTTKLSDGQHTIAIKETGKNGQVTTLSPKTVTVENVKGFIDNLYPGNVLKGNYQISGWFLDIYGVDKIEVLVDGMVVGQAVYGSNRLDVLKAYPDFNIGNSGYQYTLDTSRFSNGPHTIAIRGIAKNGRVTTLPGINVTFRQSRTVFLDPGHGGSDSGAIYGSVREADLNLAVAKKVESLLISRGYEVMMSRTNNTYVTLLDRSVMANALGPEIFVSIHHNNATSTSANGIESYYYEYNPGYPSKINQSLHNNIDRITKSVTLTNLIQNNMVSYTGANNRGTDGAAFSVIREVTMPATLLELGFLSNNNERQNLLNGSYQDKLARAIADGIDEYFKRL
ncbi:N-acetylmuramoyl-L-alanine amidase [Bacillus yapensis]|uniref:N-acetylmuramoyl-L-alanine amidase n=1 Tax=Bacillus yapensis TaxID=2492960 RepID=UPI001484D150|nr:N-acetylmuramoyl-L-alanine amidase [Bacillus yapensis]